MRNLLLLLSLTGCASIADIDTSKADYACAGRCSQNHSACVSQPATSPMVAQINSANCKDAYRGCINSCPPR